MHLVYFPTFGQIIQVKITMILSRYLNVAKQMMILKTIFLSLSILFLIPISAQSDSPAEFEKKENIPQKEAETEMLKDSVLDTFIFTLPYHTSYEVFNLKGEKVLFGTGETIDMNELPLEKFFISYDDNMLMYDRATGTPKSNNAAKLSEPESTTEVSHKLPPFKELKEMFENSNGIITVYELPYETIYQVMNSKGEVVIDDIGEFIDMTSQPKGTYTIIYDGNTVTYEKTMDPPVVKKQEKKTLTYPPEK